MTCKHTSVIFKSLTSSLAPIYFSSVSTTFKVRFIVFSDVSMVKRLYLSVCVCVYCYHVSPSVERVRLCHRCLTMIILWVDFKMFTVSTENEKSSQAKWAETVLSDELFHRRSLPKWQKPEQIRRIITQTNGLSL